MPRNSGSNKMLELPRLRALCMMRIKCLSLARGNNQPHIANTYVALVMLNLARFMGKKLRGNSGGPLEIYTYVFLGC